MKFKFIFQLLHKYFKIYIYFYYILYNISVFTSHKITSNKYVTLYAIVLYQYTHDVETREDILRR